MRHVHLRHRGAYRKPMSDPCPNSFQQNLCGWGLGWVFLGSHPDDPNVRLALRSTSSVFPPLALPRPHSSSVTSKVFSCAKNSKRPLRSDAFLSHSSPWAFPISDSSPLGQSTWQILPAVPKSGSCAAWGLISELPFATFSLHFPLPQAPQLHMNVFRSQSRWKGPCPVFITQALATSAEPPEVNESLLKMKKGVMLPQASPFPENWTHPNPRQLTWSLTEDYEEMCVCVRVCTDCIHTIGMHRDILCSSQAQVNSAGLATKQPKAFGFFP